MKNLLKIHAIFVLITVLSFSCIDDLRVFDRALDKPLGTDLTIDSIFSKA
jgi:hypothetical protein